MCALLAGVVIKETPGKWPWGPYTEELDMSDIVERLRAIRANGVPLGQVDGILQEYRKVLDAVAEAADEIERLRSIAGMATVSDGLAGIKRQFVPADAQSLSIEKEPFGA